MGDESDRRATGLVGVFSTFPVKEDTVPAAPTWNISEGGGGCRGGGGVGSDYNSYVSKAYCFLQFAMDNLRELEFVPDEPHSLYEGLAALVCLVLHISNPNRARFPMYF